MLLIKPMTTIRMPPPAPEAYDIADQRADVEPTFGAHHRGAADPEELTAETAADDADHGIEQGSQAEVLEQCARNIATDRTTNKADNEFHVRFTSLVYIIQLTIASGAMLTDF